MSSPNKKLAESIGNDLVKHTCADCDKEVLTIDVVPADDPNSIMLTTGMWVHGDEGTKPFVLCDECADDLYQKGKLGYDSIGDAFLVSNS